MKNASSFLIITFQKLFNDLHKVEFGHQLLFALLFQTLKTSHDLQRISLGTIKMYYFTFVKVCLNPMTFFKLIPL
jgi:hypothetical protein